LSDEVITFYINYLREGEEEMLGSNGDLILRDVILLDAYFYHVWCVVMKQIPVLDAEYSVEEVLKRRYVLIPIYSNQHWSLVILCHPGGGESDAGSFLCALHLNSLQVTHNSEEIFDNLDLIFKKMWGRVGRKEVPLARKRVIISRQTNSSDCGVFVLTSIVKILLNAPTVFTEKCFNSDADMFGENWSCPALLTAFRTSLLRKMKEVFAQKGKRQSRTERSDVPKCPQMGETGGVEGDAQPGKEQSLDTSEKEGVADETAEIPDGCPHQGNEKTAEPIVEEFGGIASPHKKGETNKPSPMRSEGSIDYNP
jgi:hypothetical protein